MRTQHVAMSLTLMLVAHAGCATSSIADDTDMVRELTRVNQLADVADVDVDVESSEDARHLLAQPLNADAAVRIALLNNRELRATLREMGIARGRLVTATTLANPVVEAELLPERNSQLELRVEYDISSLLLAPMRSRAYQPDVDAARYRAARAVVELGYRVRAAFYRLQSALQRLRIAERSLDAAAAARDAARAMHEAGNIPELDLVTQEAAYERGRIAVARFELEAATERERVQRLLGTHGRDSAWTVAGELDAVPDSPAPHENVEGHAIEASLELMETKQRLEGLARRAGVSRAQGWLPDIAVDAHALQGNPSSTAPPAEREWRFGAGVAVRVPIFDRRQGDVAVLTAEFDALLERYYGAAVDIRSAAREASNRVDSSYARARQYQTVIVPAQARVTQQTLLQYNAMQAGIYQLLDARREELNAELELVETRREYWTAVAELAAIAAGTRVTPDAFPSSAMPAGAAAAGGAH